MAARHEAGATLERPSTVQPETIADDEARYYPDPLSRLTRGHEEDPFRVQEEPRGHHRTPEDTPLRRFGTVRPRVQIPGPRPFLRSKSAIPHVALSRRITAG